MDELFSKFFGQDGTAFISVEPSVLSLNSFAFSLILCILNGLGSSGDGRTTRIWAVQAMAISFVAFSVSLFPCTDSDVLFCCLRKSFMIPLMISNYASNKGNICSPFLMVFPQ